MTVLGIANETQEVIFKVLSAILLVGNVEFKSDGKDGCTITNPKVLESVAELLGVNVAELTSALTIRNMKVFFHLLNFLIVNCFKGERTELEDSTEARAGSGHARCPCKGLIWPSFWMACRYN